MKKLTRYFVLLFFMILNISFLNAQGKKEADKNKTKSVLASAFKISGQIGIYGELYNISGKENRRPAKTGRVFFRPTITLFNNFNINFDVLLSTEGNYTRQSINRISMHPEWSWGRAHIGDFSQQFSNFTLNGETITGGGLELFPGIFRFEIVGGRTRRKIDNGLYNSEFARYLAGIKLGVGKTGGSFFYINVIKAKDDISSLPDYTTGNKSKAQFRLTPKENLVIGINTNLNLFKFLSMNGEVAASILSRDQNSSLIESDAIPSFVNDIIKIRTSTNVDFAYKGGVKFNTDIFNATGTYSVINPGYQSLGITSNINDQKSLTAVLGLRLFKKKLTIRGNFRQQNNNLLSQKEFTLTRTSYRISTRYQPLRNISVSINASKNLIKNDAEEDVRIIDNVISLYSINTMWRVKLLNMQHSISASYSQQKSEDMNVLREGFGSISKNLNFGISTMLNKSWTIAPRVSFNIFDMTNRIYRTTQTYSLMVMNRMLKSRLNNSLTFRLMNSSNVRTMIFGLQSGYRISKLDIIKISLRSSMYFGKLENVRDFKEFRSTISYVHRF